MTSQDIAKVAAFAGCQPRTVQNALLGKTRSLATRLAVSRALLKFGFEKQAAFVMRERGRGKGKK